MRLNLFKTKADEKIDIYYKTMTPMIESIIGTVRKEKSGVKYCWQYVFAIPLFQSDRQSLR